MFVGADHIVIAVKNLDETIRFYKKVGFTLKGQTAHHGGFVEFYGPGGTILEFHQGNVEFLKRLGESVGVRYIAFKVSDIQKIYEELRSRGIECGEPKLVQQIGRIISAFMDPDGKEIQLVGY